VAPDVRTGDLHQELTIVAASSGTPPAAIAVVRLSGSRAFAAAEALCGTLPPEREARVRALHDPVTGELLDRALVLRFAGPATATGEDVVELHCHGSRAVVAGVEAAVAGLAGCRRAQPGEFTRRALRNGRIDLAQAEALGELLQSETAAQRRQALRGTEGALGQAITRWRDILVHQAALIEAALAFEDEADVAEGEPFDRTAVQAVRCEMQGVLDAPPAERLRDGIRVVLAGPPNAGKSTLLNALTGRDVAIVSPIAGTTRDRIEAPVQRAGIPFLLIDTAGLRETDEAVEAIGVERAVDAVATADCVIWLGDDAPTMSAIWIEPRSDAPGRGQSSRLRVSATTGEGIDALWSTLVKQAVDLLPSTTELSLNARQHNLIREASDVLNDVALLNDLVLVAECLRAALQRFDAVVGRAGVEDVVDELFATFCLGK
jgi:tRNA modification GTPase